MIAESARLNLISVSQIDKRGGKVVFEKGTATILHGDDVIGKGILRNGLYWYDFNINKSSEANVMSCRDTDIWHKRLGHLNFQSLSKMKKFVKGIDTKINPEFCDTCAFAKQCRNPFDGTRTRAKRPLELVHSDVCGPSSVASYDGKRYFVTFVDDWSHMVVVYLMAKKSETFECFKAFKAVAESYHNVKVHRLRCDQGGEYSSNEFKAFCKDQGVSLEYTTAYTPQLNGVAERMNRTLVEKGRSLLVQANLPKLLWGEALLASAYLTNRSITNAVKNKTPFEAWYKSKPDVSNLRIFGCEAFVFIPSEKRTKFDNKSRRCILVGYGPNGYRLFDPQLQGIVYSRDVKFNEKHLGLDNLHFDDTHEDENLDNTVVQDQSVLAPLHTSTPKTVTRPSPKAVTPFAGTPIQETVVDEKFETPLQETIGRPKRTVRRPLRYDDYDTEFQTHCAFNFVTDAPRDYHDVISRDDKKEWLDAIDDEIGSLDENGTWKVVKDPGNVKLLGTRWVFRRKTGLEEKCKARLVVKGYLQRANVDYGETYAPVARMPTIRMLLSVGMKYDLEIHHMDVKTAFLNGFIQEDIYLKVPDGIEVPPGHVLKLEKSLYGLKQSPRAWNDRFDNFITSIGFQRSIADYCLYVLVKNETRAYIVLYVDDLLICCSDQNTLNGIKMSLASEFKMKDLGEVKCFMGMRIKIDRELKVLTIDQHEYIDRLLKKFNMYDCNGVSTPMEQNLKLLKNDDDKMVTENPYRELIGSVMYLMLATRPDICFSISFLSRFQDKATDEHWKHLKRLLRYLKETMHFALHYGCEDNVPLCGYVDADWGNDTNDRKSTSGFLFKVFGNTMSWSSKKQGLVAKSTSEAEYVAAAEACSEAIWISKVFDDLKLKDCHTPVPLFEDNAGCIFMATNPETKRSKHIDIKFHFIRDCIWTGKIVLIKVDTKEQSADLLTKSLGKILFRKFLEDVGLRGCIDK